VGRQRSLVGDDLLADLAPAGVDRRIVGVRSKAVDQVPRPDLILQCLRIGMPEGVPHGVEVIEVAEILIEPVDRR
jgi:hypothetical protein